jgi:hypothetical protein
MANSWNGHQAIVDTPTTEPIFDSNCKIKGGVWTGMLAAATLVIVDLNGKAFDYSTPEADYPVDIGPLGWLNGFAVPTISSGQLKLFFDK